MTPEQLKVAADTGWTLLTAFLVFFMNAGFGLVEAGLCRKKNATMILSKNFVVFAISTLGFYFVGFGLMFSDGGVMGHAGGWLLRGADNSPATGAEYQGIFGTLGWAGIPLTAKFFFQLVFCGTSATIVSGSVNERMKYSSFLVFSAILTAIVYPIAGHWVWGGGFLAQAGMKDFSGSTVVHSLGGWAALAGILVLGPRLGRYPEGEKPAIVPGHNMGYVFLGGMILWLGWFGFNPGSTMSLDPEAIARIAVTTTLSSATSTLFSGSMPAEGSRGPNGFRPLKMLLARPSQKLRKLKTALITVGVLRGATRRVRMPCTLNASIGRLPHFSFAPDWL